MSSAYLTLAITTAIQALVALAALAVPVLAPAAASELGFATTLVGYFVGAMYIGASTSALTSGGLILRYGSVRVSQVCLLMCAAAMALITVLPLAWMPAAAILLGAGYGPITPASSHVLVRTTPPHMMALVFSIKQTGVPVGAALAGIIVPPLTLSFGWRSASLTVAALCVMVAAI
ncbi:MAG: MFS transporter, partial [Burkholderiales bacterium]|nr:MFS transporter [Burkholderiales bacterium]